MINFTFIRFLFAKIAAFFCLILLTYNPVFSQDKTMDIVNEVQQKSNEVYQFINTLSFSGKVKVYSYMGQHSLNIDAVPYLEEYYFDGFWTKPDSVRITVKAYRKYISELFRNEASELESRFVDEETGGSLRGKYPLPNPMQFSYDESLVESGVKERLKAHGAENTWPVFPFAIGADSLYNYKKISEIAVNGRKIIEIKTSPKYPELPGIIGVFRIDEAEKYIVGARYIFNESAKIKDADLADLKKKNRFMGSIISLDENFRVESRKGLFHSVYWLPIERKEEIFMTIWGIKGRICRELEFHSYEINPEVPDQTKNKIVEFKIESELEGNVFEKSGILNELDEEEKDYIKESTEEYFKTVTMNMELLDSDILSKNAMSITFGQYSDMKAWKFGKKFSEFARYNRVEGLGLSLNTGFMNTVFSNSILNLAGGYGFADQKFKGELSYLKFFDRQQRFFFEGRLFDDITYEEDEIKFADLKNSAASLFLKEDYRDYYYVKGGAIGLGIKFRNNLALKITGVFRDEKRADKNTDFGLFNWNEDFRINPDIIEGKYKGIMALLRYTWHNGSLKIFGEYTDRDNLKSDFFYKYLKSDLDLTFSPNSNSRIILNLTSGISSDDLPPQKWFDLGGKSLMNPYGNLRGIGYKTFTGDRMFQGILEMELFRRFVFDPTEEQNDWDAFKKSLKITPWIGMCWSELSERNVSSVSQLNVPAFTADGVYTEFGIGIGDRLNIIRVDLIRNNLSENAVLFSLNFLR